MNNQNPNPSESDQQWLKELFDSAPTEPQPEDLLPGESDQEEQWLKDLFASAELAAEQALSPEEEAQKEEQSEDFSLTDWPKNEATTPEAIEETPMPRQPAEAPHDQSPGGADGQKSVAEESVAEEFGTEESSTETSDAEVVQIEDPESPDTTEKPDANLETQSEATEEPDTQAPKRKRRPKNKDSYGLFGLPHLVVTGVWLAIIVTFGVFLGQWLWKGASDVLAFGREEKLVTITITEEDDLDSLVEKLHSAGLINEPMWFRLYAQITDAMEDIGTGTFELNTLYDYHALVTHMSSSSVDRVTVKVVIPEGYTCAQVFDLLERKGVCSAADLEEAAIQGNYADYWFLENMEQTGKYWLEGFLFPDTYTFYVGDNPTRVINKFLSNFETRFNESMLEKLDVLNETLAETMRNNGLSEEEIAQRRLTFTEIIIIASLIERETSGAAEGYIISSVIYNRLTNPTKYPCLELNSALVYITGNKELTEEDKALDSPYNTFLYPGLIPGAICNPSLASMNAALVPDPTGYYYFALNTETNTHHFFENEEEYLAFLDSLRQEDEEEETP